MSSQSKGVRPSGSGRRCTRSGCREFAVATLTYIYSDSTAVLGPLTMLAEPHAFDLCATHSERLTVPKGWSVIRHVGEEITSQPSVDDLMAIADAVREVAKMETPAQPQQPEVGRRGHLRALPDLE